MDTELLQKYISGNATEAEKRHITEWMQEKPENMEAAGAYKNIDEVMANQADLVRILTTLSPIAVIKG